MDRKPIQDHTPDLLLPRLDFASFKAVTGLLARSPNFSGRHRTSELALWPRDAVVIGHIPVSGRPPCLRKPVGESASPRLHA